MPSLVTLVNQLDQEQGQAELLEAHQGRGQLHRAVSVFLFQPLLENRQTKTQDDAAHETQTKRFQLLMQQRSAEKLTAPLTWANTVCGHVQPGETYQACAQRRLADELGLTAVDLQPLTKLVYQVYLAGGYAEKELDQIFAGYWSDQKIKLNPHEVKQVRWLEWTDLTTQVGQNGADELELSPWFQYFLQEPAVIKCLNQFLST